MVADHAAIGIQASPGEGAAGFTLLELILSLSILGLILVVVFGSFRVGVRAWEKGEAEVDFRQRERIVLELLKRQLACTAIRVKKEGGDDLPYTFDLEGDGTSLSFLSHVPAVASHEFGIVYVRYEVGAGHDRGERLSVFEENIVLLDKGFSPSRLGRDDYMELLSGAERMRFHYMTRPEKGEAEGRWQASWDPDEDEGYPAAVKVVIEWGGGTTPSVVIARMEQELPED